MYPNRRIVLAPGAPVSPDTVRRLAPPFRHPQPPSATRAGRLMLRVPRSPVTAPHRFSLPGRPYRLWGGILAATTECLKPAGVPTIEHGLVLADLAVTIAAGFGVNSVWQYWQVVINLS